MALSFPSFRPQRKPRPQRNGQRSTHTAKSVPPERNHQRKHQPSMPFHRQDTPSRRGTRRSGSLPKLRPWAARLWQLPAPTAKPRLTPLQIRYRMVIVWGILLLGMLMLMLNLFRIQVFQASILKERAKAQQMIYLNAKVPRRAIVDRVGTVLAIDRPVYTLYAHPVMFQKDGFEIAKTLAPIVNLRPEEILYQFTQGESGLRVVDGLTEDLARRVTDLQLDGLELVQEQQRLYPQQDLFANIVGYVNVDRQGQSGVEYSLEQQLREPISEMALIRTGDGSVLPIGLPQDFLQQQRDDLNLQLTLDSRLQRATRLALKQQVDRFSAKRGVVIVMDVHTGAILSMVSEPSYDPNRYYEANLEQLRNWVLTDVYEPGSTFKPINVAIAMQAGSIGPDDTFFDEGAIEIGGWPIQNSDFDSNGGRGMLSVAEILQYSSNVGMVRIMQTLQPGVYYGWLSRLDLDQKTGIDLPAEAGGQMKSYQQFTNAVIEPATTAFGQGFSLTPIKLIQLHSMLANGGKMVTPHVVSGLVDPNGELKWQPPRPEPEQIFSPEVSQSVLEMMEQVVLEGTGEPAQISGYRIGGKTGTAQKAGPDGGYTSARITSFVSLFPVDAPRYAVLAVVDEPQGDDAYGSTVAAPVVKAVMEALITVDHVPPSQPIDAEESETTQDRRSVPGNYVPRRSTRRNGTGDEQIYDVPDVDPAFAD